jgi:hypothetical protein
MAKAATSEVEIFFQTCMATVPNFKGIGDLLAKHGFKEDEAGGSFQHQWGRQSDGSWVFIKEGDARRTCAIGHIGNHTIQFLVDLEKTLWVRFGLLWERKHYQGRHLYLVRIAKENVLLEVIPPSGAYTYIAAYILKEK